MSHNEISPVLDNKNEEPLVGSYFVSAYPPFSCWNHADVDRYRRRLAHPNNSTIETPLGLYVHIPFCVKRCEYCYYLSYADKSRDQIDVYLDALLVELAIYAKTPAFAGRKLDFIYFGGGTPSLLSPQRIHRLLRGLQESFSWESVREVTFECAPQTVSRAKLWELKDAGVTRLSLGVQQIDDDVLAKSGRVHLVRDVERAYAEIQRIGFSIVNVDLMVGMVGETEDSFDKSLNRVIQMAPDSVTIYQLEIPFNTPLYRALRNGSPLSSIPVWKVKRARLARGFARLEQAGYRVRSAYAAVRDAERHPFVYQDAQYHGADLLGIGVSSFSFLDGVHHQNQASFTPYIESLCAGELPLGRAYVLSDEERLIREFVLQLKLGQLDTGYFQEKFGVDVTEQFAKPLARFRDELWLTMDETRIALTREGLLRVDRMIPAFYLPEHQGVTSS